MLASLMYASPIRWFSYMSSALWLIFSALEMPTKPTTALAPATRMKAMIRRSPILMLLNMDESPLTPVRAGNR